MSRIDKLVTKAFPDELRSVRPIETDEEALFAKTLEKLGLERPADPVPEPRKGFALFPRREAKPRKLVEIPLEPVKHRWARWMGGALAACLVLSCGIYGFGWLLHSLGFGTRPQSPGDEISHPSVSAASPAPREDSAWPAEPSIEVVSCLPAANRLTVGVSFYGLSPSAYMAEARCGSQELYCMERSTEEKAEQESLLKMTFVSEQLFERMEDDRLVLRFRLIPGLLEEEEADVQAYPESLGFVLNTTSGHVQELSGEELEALWEELG